MLDPYGGSGITFVEALVLRRNAIHVDIAPLANFIAWGIAVSPVAEPALRSAFDSISEGCQVRILSLYELSDSEIDEMEIPYWYPKGVPLPKNADVETVEQCFHRRSLIALSILLYEIEKIPDRTVRDLMRLVFSATLTKTNLTFSSTQGRKESRGDSGIFRVYRYWVPERTVELNVWEQFDLRYRGWLKAKQETNLLIDDFYDPTTTARIIEGSATDLRGEVADESVDYIFTDPPYGAHIEYLDLSTMWNAWLRFEISDESRELEVIEGGSLDKSRDSYLDLLSESIKEMFRVLKWDRWMSIVFAHKDTVFWEALVTAAQDAGFEYVNTTVQRAYSPSMHKRKNPLTVLSGELILNFRKVSNPQSIAISSVGPDVVRLIQNTAELAIVKRNGATTEEIYHTLIPVLLEGGRLGEVRKKIPDLSALLSAEFDYSTADERWHIRPNVKVGSYIALDERIRFYLTDYLKSVSREGGHATFDDIILNVIPNLVNGKQPSEESVLDVLRSIAYSPNNLHWQLNEHESGQTNWSFDDPAAIPPLSNVGEVSHDEMIYRLAKLASSAKVVVHVGKNEQPSVINGERLGDLSALLPRDEKKWSRSKVEQIDCIFMDHPAGRFLYAFEIEASTTITSAIDRFLELLTADSSMAGRLVVVIPRKRQAKLASILKDSHYIGHPLYMENKIGWLFYEDLLRIYSAFAGQTPPSWAALNQRIDAAVRTVKLPE